MTTYSFELELLGTHILDDVTQARLYDAGCADAAFEERNGSFFASVDRSAPSIAVAVLGAIRQIESVPGVRVNRVTEQDVVGIPDIAARTNRTRQSVWQLFKGERGEGNFPKPVLNLGDERSLWRWQDVADWFSQRQGLPKSEEDIAGNLETINMLLKTRNKMSDLAGPLDTEMVPAVAPQYGARLPLTYASTGQTSTVAETEESVAVTASGLTTYACAA